MDNQENTVLAVEWESSKKAAIEKGGANQVLVIAAHPDGDVIVTCGYKHVKFWTVEKGHMYATSGSFGAGKPQTMICIQFTEEDEGVPPLTLTGAQNGCIYMWREHHLHRIIVAHSSPILDMGMTFDDYPQVITCGIDGLVRLWSAEWTSCARLDVAELTRGLQAYSAGVMTPVQSVVLLQEEDAESRMRRFVVGMETNEVYLFSFNGNPEDVDVLPETQILVQGHAAGALCQVCAHPSLQEFATIGHDKTLRTWDCDQFSPIDFVRLPEMGSALSYFPDGKSVAAGLTNGAVLRIDTTSAGIETILEKRAKMVTRIKFSPSGKLLAVGYESGIIDVLDVGAICVPLFFCKAIGSIEQVDFSTDEQVLQCSTAAMDLSFWNLSSSHPGKQINRPAEFRDKSWATWSSRFGFAVQALSPNVREITSVQKAQKPVLLTALTSGRFAAYRYPAIGESVKRKSFHAHLAPLADICFTTGDQRLISVGMTDCTIVQWKVSVVAPEASTSQVDGSDAHTKVKKDAVVGTRIVFFFLDYVFDEWESRMEDMFIARLSKVDSNLSKEGIRIVEVLPGSVILKVQMTAPRISRVVNVLETDHRNPVGHLRKDLKVLHLITDEDIFFSSYRPKPDSTYLSKIPTVEIIPEISLDPDLQKPYISTSFQPNITPDKDKSKMPVEYLELEHVHGFAGFNRIGNLFYVQTGEVLYTVGTLAIVHDLDTGRQCFFRKHAHEIVAVTLHTDGQLVATADNGPASTVFVWSSVTMEALMRLNANQVASVVCMCFSSDDTRLIVVSEIAEALVEIFEWRKKKLHVVQQIDRNKILAVKSNPYDEATTITFVTSGVNHIRGWSLKGDVLKGHNWTGDSKGKGTLQAIPTTCFPSKNCVVAATQNGSLYVFKISSGSLMLVKTIEKAHRGPIFELWCNQTTVLSGGKDGILHRWRFSVKLGSVDLQYLKSSDMRDETCSTIDPVAIKSISYRESPPAVIVGTSKNQVFEINEISNQKRLVVLGHAGGHSAKALNQSLSLHPLNPDLMLSGGADGNLVLWDLKDRKSLEQRMMDAPIGSVQYSNNGESFAVGLKSGHIFVHTSSGVHAEMLAPEKQRSNAVHVVKFSPNDQFLGVGLDPNWIDIYDVAGKRCSLVATLKGHASPITEIDWEKGSEMMRSVSSSLELLYWDVPAKMQIKRIKELENAEWHTHHCKLGWYAKGILQASGNEHTIFSIDVTKDHRMMAVSSCHGQVKLLHFPCIDALSSACVVAGHAPLVTRLRFTSDSQRLLTLGGKDQSILQWRLAETTLDPLVKVLVGKAEPGKPLYQLPCNVQMKTMMVESFSRKIQHEEPPTSHLELDFVHGYGGHNNHANLFVVASGELLYNAGALCVVFDHQARSQIFFREHQHDVMSMALHPDGIHVVSADCGISPVICVWNAEALVCLARLDGGGLAGIGGFESGVCALAFSPDGAQIAAVGADKDHTLYLLDWRAKRTVAAGKCGSGRILACAFSPYEKSLITCGVLHVKFWTSSGARMIGREGVFGKHVQKCTMQCVDVNPANFAQHAGQKGVTLTGGMDGKIYLFGSIMTDAEWRPEVLNQAVVAHTGPVFDIRHDKYTLLIASCGGDGTIKTWKLKTYLNPKDKSKTEIDLVIHETIHIFEILAGLPVHVSSATLGKSVLFSKLSTGPTLLIGTNTDEVLQVSINTESKIFKDANTHLPLPATLLVAGQGGSISDLITHPTQPLSFSVGRDSVLKMWDTSKKCLLAAKGFEELVVSVDFSSAGSHLAVAAADGTVIVYHACLETEEDGNGSEYWAFSELSRESAKGPASIIRFSGDVMGERFVAVGRTDGLIDFFNVNPAGTLAFVETSRADGDKHQGPIISLDWSSHPQGYVQSTCDRGGLFYWGPLPSVRRETNQEIIGGLELESWSSRVGWPVKSLSECFESIEHVTAVARSHNNQLIVVSHVSGFLAVCHFPCPHPFPGSPPPTKEFSGHSHSPVAVRFLNNDTQILSAGGTDCCFIQWRHFLHPPKYHPELASFCDSVAMHTIAEQNVATGDTASSMLAPLKWKPTRKVFETASQAPSCVFQLEHAYGYRGHDMKGNIVFLHRKNAGTELAWTGEILYHIAGVAVIYNVLVNQQRLVQLGMKSIISQALSEDALRVVTGEAGDDPAVVVWRSTDGLEMNRFQGFHKNGIVAVCFATSVDSGGRIMTVGGDEFHTVAVYDLTDTIATSKDHTPLAWRSGGSSDIMAVSCYQLNGQDVYVTVGKQHIRSWTVERHGENNAHQLIYQRAIFGEFDSFVTFTCVTFVQSLVVVGADNGSIYLMSHNHIVSLVECAHNSGSAMGVPVLDLDVVSDQIVSSGSDGKVTFWTLSSTDNNAMLIKKDGQYDIGEISKRAKNLNQNEGSIHAFSPAPNMEIPLSVKSVKCLMIQGSSSSTEEMQVLMGTGSNEIILRSSVSKKQTIVMQGHLGGSVNGVAAHPNTLLFATVGRDMSCKVWDAENRMLLATGFADDEINCVEWAPKAQTNSHHLAAGLVRGKITVFQYTVGKGQMSSNSIKIEEHYQREALVCIKFSPDSMQLALGSSCGHIDVYDVIQGYVWTGGAHISHSAVSSIDWSYDCKTLQVSTAELKISYWDVSRKDLKTFARQVRDVNRDQVWGSWTSSVGWPVNGISWEKNRFGQQIKNIDVLANFAGSFDCELVKGDLDVPNLILATTADGMHLLNFPVLQEARSASVVHPAKQTASACFSRDASRVYSVGGDGLCILQWRLLSPNEVGLSGQITRAQRAVQKDFTLLDREKFWKISRKEIDELKRRGVRSDIVRIVDPQSRELQEARLQVVDFTFEQIDMTLIGRDVGGQPMILPLDANVCWNEVLVMLEQFVHEKDADGAVKSFCFMYEKFNVNTKEGWTEVSEMRLRKLQPPSMREAEIIKLKNESRISFSVKTELDFRQCWHWMEHEYRWVLSDSSDVPEGQRFPLSVYLIPYIKKSKKKTETQDTGEASDAESDVDALLQARRGVSKKKEVEEEKKKEKKLEFSAPTGWDELDAAVVSSLESAPLFRLTLESMHGYNGRKSSGNIVVLKGGEIVYPVGSSIIVHDRLQNKQKTFSDHNDIVMCLSVSHDREILASATTGENPELCIWNGYSFAVKQRFVNDHESCITSLSFSRKDPWIASVGGDNSKEMMIVVYDYVQGTTIVKEDRAGKNRIISIAFNPHMRSGEMSFVTVGVRHVRFWNLQRSKLVGRKGTYDIGRGSESMMSIAFTDPDHVSASKDIVFTGSKDGRVFIWRDTKAVWNVQCCSGPVFDLLVYGGTVVSGGKDNTAPIREWKVGMGWPTRLELTPAKGSDDQGLALIQRSEGSAATSRAGGACVRALAWNGTELIVGTSSNSVHTLNPRNGVSKLFLQGHTKGAITALATHPSKPLLVSVGDDGAVRVLNWKDKSCVQFRSLNEGANAVTVSQAYSDSAIAGMTEAGEGEHIAVGLQSGELRILSMATLDDVNGLVRDYGTSRCQEHSTSRQNVGIFALCYSPDGEWLALGAGDAVLDIYKVSAGYLHVQSCDGHEGPVSSIDWSATKTVDGVQYIHTCSIVGRTVMHWAMTPAKDGDVDIQQVSQIQLRDEPWHTWTLSLGWPVQAIGAALATDGTPTCLERSSQGKLLAVGDSSGELSVFQCPCVSSRASAVNNVIKHSGGISAVAFTPDESRIITAGLNDQMIMVSLFTNFATLSKKRDGQDTVTEATTLVRNLCAFVSLSNNLKMVAAVLSDLEVKIWDVEGLKDGAWSCNVKSGLAGHSQSVNSCRFSPNDKSVCTASRDNSLRLWEIEGTSARSFQHQKDVIASSFSPNGKLVAGSDTNKMLLVWDASGLANESLRARAEGHRKAVLCVAWSDDSRRLCTGSEDKTLRIWDIPEGVYRGAEPTFELPVVCRLRGHTEAVVSCAFSAHESTSDKMRVCSGSMDKTVIVWDVGTGSELCRISFEDCLLGCNFSMCSAFVGAVCLDNSVHIWDVSVDGEPELVDKYVPTTSAAVNVVGCAFTEDGTLPVVLARPPDRLVHATTLYLPQPKNVQ